MNLKHLYYFWKTAKCGGVVRAAQALNLTPQTISGQLRQLESNLDTKLFLRDGKSMELSVAGQVAMDYANEMFALGAELERALRDQSMELPASFHVGVSDAIPKVLVHRLLRPAIALPGSIRLVCREWRLDRLLNELGGHRLDMVIADSPTRTSARFRSHNHRLAISGLSFFASADLIDEQPGPFPTCLEGMPFLMPGEDSAVRGKLETWLKKANVYPNVVGEFDDMALATAFGQAGEGVFAVPTLIEDEFLDGRALRLLGRTEEVRIEYFAITVSRKNAHPCVAAITARWAVESNRRRASDGHPDCEGTR